MIVTITELRNRANTQKKTYGHGKRPTKSCQSSKFQVLQIKRCIVSVDGHALLNHMCLQRRTNTGK